MTAAAVPAEVIAVHVYRMRTTAAGRPLADIVVDLAGVATIAVERVRLQFDSVAHRWGLMWPQGHGFDHAGVDVWVPAVSIKGPVSRLILRALLDEAISVGLVPEADRQAVKDWPTPGEDRVHRAERAALA